MSDDIRVTQKRRRSADPHAIWAISHLLGTINIFRYQMVPCQCIKTDGFLHMKLFTLLCLYFQYFDNLVTCRYWHHAWLNEGLATFYGTRAVMEVDPTLLHVSTKVQRNG